MSSTPGAVPLPDDLLEAAAGARRQAARRRGYVALAVSVSVTVVWLIGVTATGHWDRVIDQWEVALTMVFGSFVAGSTPQGGGAVAFPVLTKVVEAPAEVARTFSLCIQTVGMGAATASIVVQRRPVAWRAVRICAPIAVVTFAITAFALSDPDAPFRPSLLPGPWVKVTFTIVLAAMATVVVLGRRLPVRLVEADVPLVGPRVIAATVLAAVGGGAASALVGSGADVAIYLLVVVLLGVDARIGVPTSVIVMTCVSVAGFVLLGLFDGQLDVTVVAGSVTAVGGEPVGTAVLPAEQADLFGMWLSAVPIVAWGAPLGALVASRMSAAALSALVVGLATAEVLSTAIFLDELRTDAALAIYAVGGVIVAAVGLSALALNRRTVLGLPAVEADRTLRRPDVDAASDWSERVVNDDEPRERE